MPVYDFKCPACETTFEVSRGFAAASDPVNCPADGTLCQRIYSMPAVVRGGGAAAAPSAAAGAAGPKTPSDKPPSKWNSHGHAHGPGGASHTH